MSALQARADRAVNLESAVAQLQQRMYDADDYIASMQSAHCPSARMLVCPRQLCRQSACRRADRSAASARGGARTAAASSGQPGTPAQRGLLCQQHRRRAHCGMLQSAQHMARCKGMLTHAARMPDDAERVC